MNTIYSIVKKYAPVPPPAILTLIPAKKPPTLAKRLDRIATKEGQALDTLFAQHGLLSRIDGKRIMASQVAGYLRYHIKRGDSVKKIMPLRDDMSVVLTESRGQEIHVRIHKTLLYIEVPYPLERRSLFWSDIDLSSLRPQQMAIGRDYSGTAIVPVGIDFTDKTTASMLVSGVPGSGKTAALITAIMSLAWVTPPDEATIIIIDPKGDGAMSHLEGLPHVQLCTELEDSQAAIMAVKNELIRRRTQPDKRKIYLVVEELTALVDEAGSQKQAIFAMLRTLAGMGREKNVHVIACTQKAHTDVVDSTFRGNLPIKLAGQVTTADESKIATGKDGVGCEFLPGKGSFYFLSGGSPQRIQTYYIPEEDLARISGLIRKKWAGVEPYRIEMIQAMPLLPELPEKVTAQQLFTVVGTYQYSQLFKDGELRPKMKITLIRLVFGETARDTGNTDRWTKAAVPYLRDYWQDITDAMEGLS